MAGSYPNAPSRRMAWDADGSVFAGRNTTQGTAIVELGSTRATELNDEDTATVEMVGLGPLGGDSGDSYWLGLIFPELREFDGIFLKGNAEGSTTDTFGLVESSGDTTNFIDGTWTSRIANWSDVASVIPGFRDSITSLAVSNVRGVLAHRGGGGNSGRFAQAFHVYGEIAPGETPDRLLWVDNVTGSEFGLPIDYGDIPRGSAEDREVLLRNNSGSLSASSVQVTAESPYLDSGSWYTIKEAGGSFQATLPLSSSIGAGSDSPVLTIRRITPDDETLGLHAGRAVASVGSWS